TKGSDSAPLAYPIVELFELGSRLSSRRLRIDVQFFEFKSPSLRKFGQRFWIRYEWVVVNLSTLEFREPVGFPGSEKMSDCGSESSQELCVVGASYYGGLKSLLSHNPHLSQTFVDFISSCSFTRCRSLLRQTGPSL